MATTTRPTQAPTDPSGRPAEPSTQDLAQAISGPTSAAAAVSTGLERPQLEPPGTSAGAAALASTAWLNNKHVLMLWQNATAKNNWAYLDGGVGWKQLIQTDEGAARGLGLLTSGARISSGIVNAYEGSAGTIEALYLW